MRNKNNTMKFALFLCALLLGACERATDIVIAENQLDEATVSELQAAMTAGEFTAVDITEYYLRRIQELDPMLYAVIEVNPDALQIAAVLDAERAAGQVRSPLHGIPVMLKDNIDTADNMLTTAGSLALVDAPAPAQDAFLVTRLRAAGAIILAKTNLSEWANFRASNSSSGWSARGGQTRNPYNTDRSPCGSSAGSGVAVAANLTMLAVGTETNGSIICPAANNSNVGIKPTLGLISRSGIIPIAHTQDTAGPMTRTVTDAAIMLTAMTGADAEDAITVNEHTATPIDYTEHLSRNGLQGKRIGVLHQLFARDPRVGSLMAAHLTLLEQAGAELVNIEIAMPEGYGAASLEVLLHEFKHDLNAYLSKRGGEYQNLQELIDFNFANAELEMPYADQQLFLDAQNRGDLNAAVYIDALRLVKQATQEQGLDAALQENNLDAIVAPSNGAGWLIDPLDGDKSGLYVSSAGLAAVSGYPSITVPAGYINGRPIGVSFMGAAFSEPVLLGIAFDFEQRTLARRAPVVMRAQ